MLELKHALATSEARAKRAEALVELQKNVGATGHTAAEGRGSLMATMMTLSAELSLVAAKATLGDRASAMKYGERALALGYSRSDLEDAVPGWSAFGGSA